MIRRTEGPTRALATLALLVIALPAGAARAERQVGAVRDPIQGFNRGVFAFNDGLDRYFLEPVATGWDFVLPDPVQRSLSRFFANARYPITFVNTLLQGKVARAGEVTTRFMVNTTFGIAGFFDVAAKVGLERRDEDFGQSLGVWGASGNPYLMLPLAGPANPRDGVGMLVDSVSRVWPYFVAGPISLAVGGVEVLNARSLLLDEVRTAREQSLDYYVFVREAYSQYRQALIADSAGLAEAEQESLYYVGDSDGEDLYEVDEDPSAEQF